MLVLILRDQWRAVVPPVDAGGLLATADRRVVHGDLVMNIIVVVVVHSRLVVEVQVQRNVVADGRADFPTAPAGLAIPRLDLAQRRRAAELVETEVERAHARTGEPH